MKEILTERKVEEKHIEIESANDLELDSTNYVIEIPKGDIVTIEQECISRIHLKRDRIHIWFMDGTHANYHIGGA